MKLLYCDQCQDVRKVGLFNSQCRCGKVWARYVDNINVEWNGKGHLLGFANGSFVSALKQPTPRADGFGHRFEAFVIPVTAPTVSIVTDTRTGLPPKAAWPFPNAEKP